MVEYLEVPKHPEQIARDADAARYPAPRKVAAMRRYELGQYLTKTLGLPIDPDSTKDAMILAYNAHQAGVPIGVKQDEGADMKIQQMRKLCKRLGIQTSPSDNKASLQAKLDEFANAPDAS